MYSTLVIIFQGKWSSTVLGQTRKKKVIYLKYATSVSTETSNLQPLGSGCCTGLNWLMNYVTHTVRTLGPEKSKSQAHSNLVIFICPKRPDVT